MVGEESLASGGKVGGTVPMDRSKEVSLTTEMCPTLGILMASILGRREDGTNGDPE